MHLDDVVERQSDALAYPQFVPGHDAVMDQPF